MSEMEPRVKQQLLQEDGGILEFHIQTPSVESVIETTESEPPSSLFKQHSSHVGSPMPLPTVSSSVNLTSPTVFFPLAKLQNMNLYDFCKAEKTPENSESDNAEKQSGFSNKMASNISSTISFPEKSTFSLSSLENLSSTYATASSAESSWKEDSVYTSEDNKDVTSSSVNLTGLPLSTRFIDSIFAPKKVHCISARKSLTKSANPIKLTYKPSISPTLFTKPSTEKNKVLCHVCCKTFCHTNSFNVHFSSAHLKQRHKCTVEGCNKTFSSRKSRKRHSANPNPRLHSSNLKTNFNSYDERIANFYSVGIPRGIDFPNCIIPYLPSHQYCGSSYASESRYKISMISSNSSQKHTNDTKLFNNKHKRLSQLDNDASLQLIKKVHMQHDNVYKYDEKDINLGIKYKPCGIDDNKHSCNFGKLEAEDITLNLPKNKKHQYEEDKNINSKSDKISERHKEDLIEQFELKTFTIDKDSLPSTTKGVGKHKSMNNTKCKIISEKDLKHPFIGTSVSNINIDHCTDKKISLKVKTYLQSSDYINDTDNIKNSDTKEYKQENMYEILYKSMLQPNSAVVSLTNTATSDSNRPYSTTKGVSKHKTKKSTKSATARNDNLHHKIITSENFNSDSKRHNDFSATGLRHIAIKKVRKHKSMTLIDSAAASNKYLQYERINSKGIDSNSKIYNNISASNLNHMTTKCVRKRKNKKLVKCAATIDSHPQYEGINSKDTDINSERYNDISASDLNYMTTKRVLKRKSMTPIKSTAASDKELQHERINSRDTDINSERYSDITASDLNYMNSKRVCKRKSMTLIKSTAASVKDMQYERVNSNDIDSNLERYNDISPSDLNHMTIKCVPKRKSMNPLKYAAASAKDIQSVSTHNFFHDTYIDPYNEESVSFKSKSYFLPTEGPDSKKIIDTIENSDGKKDRKENIYKVHIKQTLQPSSVVVTSDSFPSAARSVSNPISINPIKCTTAIDKDLQFEIIISTDFDSNAERHDDVSVYNLDYMMKTVSKCESVTPIECIGTCDNNLHYGRKNSKDIDSNSERHNDVSASNLKDVTTKCARKRKAVKLVKCTAAIDKDMQYERINSKDTDINSKRYTDIFASDLNYMTTKRVRKCKSMIPIKITAASDKDMQYERMYSKDIDLNLERYNEDPCRMPTKVVHECKSMTPINSTASSDKDLQYKRINLDIDSNSEKNNDVSASNQNHTPSKCVRKRKNMNPVRFTAGSAKDMQSVSTNNLFRETCIDPNSEKENLQKLKFDFLSTDGSDSKNEIDNIENSDKKEDTKEKIYKTHIKQALQSNSVVVSATNADTSASESFPLDRDVSNPKSINPIKCTTAIDKDLHYEIKISKNFDSNAEKYNDVSAYHLDYMTKTVSKRKSVSPIKCTIACDNDPQYKIIYSKHFDLTSEGYNDVYASDLNLMTTKRMHKRKNMTPIKCTAASDKDIQYKNINFKNTYSISERYNNISVSDLNHMTTKWVRKRKRIDPVKYSASSAKDIQSVFTDNLSRDTYIDPDNEENSLLKLNSDFLSTDESDSKNNIDNIENFDSKKDRNEKMHEIHNKPTLKLNSLVITSTNTVSSALDHLSSPTKCLHKRKSTNPSKCTVASNKYKQHEREILKNFDSNTERCNDFSASDNDCVTHGLSKDKMKRCEGISERQEDSISLGALTNGMNLNKPTNIINNSFSALNRISYHAPALGLASTSTITAHRPKFSVAESYSARKNNSGGTSSTSSLISDCHLKNRETDKCMSDHEVPISPVNCHGFKVCSSAVPVANDNCRKCKVCDKVFQNAYGAKTHYENVHLKLMHKCKVNGCIAEFPSKRSRDRHSANLKLHQKLLFMASYHISGRYFDKDSAISPFHADANLKQNEKLLLMTSNKLPGGYFDDSAISPFPADVNLKLQGKLLPTTSDKLSGGYFNENNAISPFHDDVNLKLQRKLLPATSGTLSGGYFDENSAISPFHADAHLKLHEKHLPTTSGKSSGGYFDENSAIFPFHADANLKLHGKRKLLPMTSDKLSGGYFDENSAISPFHADVNLKQHRKLLSTTSGKLSGGYFEENSAISPFHAEANLKLHGKLPPTTSEKLSSGYFDKDSTIFSFDIDANRRNIFSSFFDPISYSMSVANISENCKINDVAGIPFIEKPLLPNLSPTIPDIHSAFLPPVTTVPNFQKEINMQHHHRNEEQHNAKQSSVNSISNPFSSSPSLIESSKLR